MFTIHLTPEKYRASIDAARHYEERADAESLHIACESEPNLKIGDEVEVVVETTRQIGIVVGIKAPHAELSAAQREQLRRLEERDAEAFKKQYGVDPRTFPKDDHQQELLNSQWYVLLKSK